MAINTLAQFRDYIRRELGGGSFTNISEDEPTINVEMSVAQLNQAIEKSISYAARYLFGEGNYEDFYILTLAAGVSAYSLSALDAIGALDYTFAGGSSTGPTSVFVPAAQITQTDFFYSNLVNNGLGLTTYEVYLSYFEQIQEAFSVRYRINFIPARSMITITPTPTEQIVGALRVFRKEISIELYNNILVQELAIANAKIIWGGALSKMKNAELPGGGNFGDFGTTIKSEGREDKEKIIEKMQSESYGGWFTTG